MSLSTCQWQPLTPRVTQLTLAGLVRGGRYINLIKQRRCVMLLKGGNPRASIATALSSEHKAAAGSASHVATSTSSRTLKPGAEAAAAVEASSDLNSGDDEKHCRSTILPGSTELALVTSQPPLVTLAPAPEHHTLADLSRSGCTCHGLSWAQDCNRSFGNESPPQQLVLVLASRQLCRSFQLSPATR